MVITHARTQSPSSINIYKQCPRKYYYQYIEKIPTKTNIHLVRGSIAHKILEDFFSIEIKDDDPLLGDTLFRWINSLFEKEWEKNKDDLSSLDMEKSQLDFYKEETKAMLNTWLGSFLKRLSKAHDNPSKAFEILTPRMEVLYHSDNYGVKGFIDVIEEIDDEVRLIDYKTSKKAHLSDAYKLQLAIYALLYKEKHGVMPRKVGISFLKFGEIHELAVDQKLLDFAELEIELIHMNTQFRNKEDYPKNITPLCKWSTGQCDFYDVCFKSKR
ncbi:MAG: RecB family exonuclease [Candidatus Woesearchaeota archaeon]